MKKVLLPVLALLIAVVSCTTLDTFEKNVAIPDQQWHSTFIPEISFDISDTIPAYNLYVVVRHTDAYRYNNLWINLYSQLPDGKTNKQRFELRLATDDKGWLGSGMDDIFEHRILIAPVHFPKSGIYRFRIENIMRDDPLEHVMNIGIRIEKAL